MPSTTRTQTYHRRYFIQCRCGHVGALQESSTTFVEKVCNQRSWLERLRGSPPLYVTGKASLVQVWSYFRPTCPRCGMVLEQSKGDTFSLHSPNASRTRIGGPESGLRFCRIDGGAGNPIHGGRHRLTKAFSFSGGTDPASLLPGTR